MHLPFKRAGIARIDADLSRGAVQQAAGKILGMHLGGHEAGGEGGGQREDHGG